jgi:hypothetical protein
MRALAMIGAHDELMLMEIVFNFTPRDIGLAVKPAPAPSTCGVLQARRLRVASVQSKQQTHHRYSTPE